MTERIPNSNFPRWSYRRKVSREAWSTDARRWRHRRTGVNNIKPLVGNCLAVKRGYDVNEKAASSAPLPPKLLPTRKVPEYKGRGPCSSAPYPLLLPKEQLLFRTVYVERYATRSSCVKDESARLKFGPSIYMFRLRVIGWKYDAMALN